MTTIPLMRGQNLRHARHSHIAGTGHTPETPLLPDSLRSAVRGLFAERHAYRESFE